jgi:hypothetical protein
MRGLPAFSQAATAHPAPKTSRNPPMSSTFGSTYIKVTRPIAPPTDAPPKRRIAFWLLAPTVESATTKTVMTHV